MEILTKLEELVLIAVLQLKDQAYGIPIYDYVVHKTGNEVSVSSVYFPLERMVRKGYLKSFKGETTPKRGGMRKRFYALTPKGVNSLQEHRALSRMVWKEVEDKIPGIVKG